MFADAVHGVTSLFLGQWFPGTEDPHASLFLQGWSVPSRAHRDRFPLDGNIERVAGTEVQRVTQRLGQDETPRLVERRFHEYQFTMGNAICQMALQSGSGITIFKPLLVGILENFFYRQSLAPFKVKAFWDFLCRKRQWGRMDRSSFKKQAPPEQAEAPASR